jgi:16S rRNA (cytidine1402-2'-O)-methyltransferase
MAWSHAELPGLEAPEYHVMSSGLRIKLGTLYIVGTPIGNLEDVTMRALRVLREVDLIAAEDTRRTARLLQHYSIATPATSLHEHNERGKSPHLIRKLLDGASIAVVSDAGMPLVSDPGALLVRAARDAGIPVQVVPGPSAVTAALAGAGISGPFAFLGFPPASGKSRKSWFAQLGHTTSVMTVVFFESPHRLSRTLRALTGILGDRPIVVGRELTKIFESLVEQPINGFVADSLPPRGEYVVVIPHALVRQDPAAIGRGAPGASDLMAEFGEMTESGGLKPKAAAKALAAKYGVPAGDIYRLCARGSDDRL